MRYSDFYDNKLGDTFNASKELSRPRIRAMFQYWQRGLPEHDDRKTWKLHWTPTGLVLGENLGTIRRGRKVGVKIKPKPIKNAKTLNGNQPISAMSRTSVNRVVTFDITRSVEDLFCYALYGGFQINLSNEHETDFECALVQWWQATGRRVNTKREIDPDTRRLTYTLMLGTP